MWIHGYVTRDGEDPEWFQVNLADVLRIWTTDVVVDRPQSPREDCGASSTAGKLIRRITPPCRGEGSGSNPFFRYREYLVEKVFSSRSELDLFPTVRSLSSGGENRDRKHRPWSRVIRKTRS